MNLAQQVEIDAPTDAVWSVYSDVERWPEWTPTVTAVRPLDGAGLAEGHRFEIDQPRYPRLVWAVDALEPGRSWTWRQRSPGAASSASHRLVDLPGGRTRVELAVEQRGVLGSLVGLLTRRRARRYLELEATGLKARVEGRAVDAPSA